MAIKWYVSLVENRAKFSCKAVEREDNETQNARERELLPVVFETARCENLACQLLVTGRHFPYARVVLLRLPLRSTCVRDASQFVQLT